MRVVSLLPSATEIVYALGVEPVGVSHECDHPPAATDRPAVNRSRVDADASSAEIDAQVQAAEESGGVYEVDRETFAALDPDLVVSQGICDVCAVDEVLVREAVDDLGLDADVLTTDPHSLGDVLDDIDRIGAALHREEAARTLRADLQSRVDAVAEETPSAEGTPSAESTASARERPSVVVLDWLDPAMVAGHWVPELVALAGGTYPLADPGERSRPREWREIREADPDVLIAAPCGFGLDQTSADLPTLTDRPGWDDLAAVEAGAVYAMDGHHYVNRPGPRLVDTLEALAGVLHPALAGEPATEIVRPVVPTERV